MKTPDDNGRGKLLADLFPDEASGLRVSAEDVLQWVDAERRSRARRRVRLASVGLLLVGMVAGWGLWPSRMENESTKTAVQVAVPAPPKKDAGSTMVSAPPKVARIDDDELLGMIDDVPAALVQWPDGRRSLLVVVTPAR